jgi:hypothetical protein
VSQLQNQEIKTEVIIDLLCAFAPAANEVLNNAGNAYRRYRNTKEYKMIAKSIMQEPNNFHQSFSSTTPKSNTNVSDIELV